MTEPLPTERLREAIQARKEIHPMEYRVVNLEKKSKEQDTSIKGSIWSVNTCLGNTRENVEDIKSMRQVIIVQAETISGMQVAIGSLQADLVEAMELIGKLQADLVAGMERVDKMSQIAKTKGW